MPVTPRADNIRSSKTLSAFALFVLALSSSAVAQGPALTAAPRPMPVPKSGPVPREPGVEQKLQSEFKAPPGFNVTLFAGPPVAGYPTCLAEAAEGVVFVCVDPNLSLSQIKGVGRVMRLVDDDHDGRADRYTVFAEMDSPRGAVFDGKTLYVMHPPFLTAYRDTDGDGIADEKQDIVTGLGFDLDFRGADHTTNNIQLGIDGWLYVAVGDYGFMKAVGSDGTQIQHRGGAVVRVRPDGTHLELYAVGTRNIFDVALDPFLHVFARDNTNDGDGWDTRLHYIPAGANMGYPNLYQNFPTEHFPSLADYGAGAGVGAVWIQDPAWPDGFNNTLYTGDWTIQKIYRHPVTAQGASFAVKQEEFIALARPSDLILDDRSNLYVASLSGGQFTYNGDTVGYVVRVNYPGRTPPAPPNVATLNAKQLVAVLTSPNAIHRQHAQQELLRRARSSDRSADAADIVRGTQQLVANAAATADARVAAMFTLKQVAGAQANATIAQAATATDPRVRELALRALADRTDELEGVTAAPFVKGLSDPDASVRTQAIIGLVRVGARDAAGEIMTLAGSDDAALSHLAIHALVALDARDAALSGLDAGSPAVKVAALRALGSMHDASTVTALLERLGRATSAAERAPLLHTLGRLLNKEGYWRGEWWTTRPQHLGPYFDPSLWEESPRIRTALRRALAAANGDEFASLVGDFVLNQVLPRGAQPLLVALAAGSPQRERALDALVGSAQVHATAAPLLIQLDQQSPALHAAVVELIVAESAPTGAMVPLVRGAALDTTLAPRSRERAIAALTQMPGIGNRDVIVEVLSRLNPHGGTPSPGGGGAAAPVAASPLETGWRRYVASPGRRQELDYFITLATTGQPAQRVLAYAVLVQAVRAPRTPQPIRDRVQPVLDAAWSDSASAPSLVEAITIMRAESQYVERLRAHQSKPEP